MHVSFVRLKGEEEKMRIIREQQANIQENFQIGMFISISLLFFLCFFVLIRPRQTPNDLFILLEKATKFKFNKHHITTIFQIYLFLKEHKI